jgi:hypothetical protein
MLQALAETLREAITIGLRTLLVLRLSRVVLGAHI